MARKVAASKISAIQMFSSTQPDKPKKPAGLMIVAGSKVQLPRFIVNPTSRWKTAWDMWMAVLILYSVIMVPVRVGFAWRSCIFAADWSWDIFVDLCFLVDITLTFRTAIFVDGGEKNQQFVITDPRSIAWRYLRSWLVLDVLSTMPVNVIVDLTLYANASPAEAANMRSCAYLTDSSSDVSSNLRSVQSLRVIRIIRLLKLFRFLKLGIVLRRWEDQVNLNPAFFRLTRLFVAVLFLSHLIACLWFGMFKLIIPEGREWIDDNWLAAYAAIQATPQTAHNVRNDAATQYLSAMYWAFTTMTTVGYGDILPSNLWEMWFVILMEFVGLIVFGMAIASMTNILANFNLQKKLRRERMAVINRYVRERDLTQRMQRRVRRFYEYYLERVSVFDVTSMLDEVSQSLKNDLCEVMLRDLITDLPLLQNRDASFVAIIGMQLQPFFSLPGEFVARRGVIGLEVYWVRKGRVQLRWGTSQRQVGYLSDGDHFGEEVLHSTDLKMTSDVRAVTYCDLLYVQKQALEKLNDSYPNLIDELKRDGPRTRMQAHPPPTSTTPAGVVPSSTAPPAADAPAATLTVEQRLRQQQSQPAGNSSSNPSSNSSASGTGTAVGCGSSSSSAEPSPLALTESAVAASGEDSEGLRWAVARPSSDARPKEEATEAATSDRSNDLADVPRPPEIEPPSPARSSQRSSRGSGPRSSSRGGERVSASMRCASAMHSALNSARRSISGGRLSSRRRSDRLSKDERASTGAALGGDETLRRREFENDIKAMALERHKEARVRKASLSPGQAKAVGANSASSSAQHMLQHQGAGPRKFSVMSLAWTDQNEELRLRQELAKEWILHPGSPGHAIWDMALAVLVIYSIVIVPLRIGFDLEAPATSFIFWFEVSIDFIFIADIVVNFRTAYVAADGQLERRPRHIAFNYMKSWFVVDLSSSIPIDLILLTTEMSATEDTQGDDNRSALRLTRMIKALRLVRLLKLLRLLKITKYLKTAQEDLQLNPLVLELLALAVKTLFLMHLAACVWHWSAQLMLPDTPPPASRNTTAFDERVDAAMETWLQYFAETHFQRGEWPSTIETYTASMYWALTTMSTIGYGDIRSITNLERVVSIVIMLVGSVIFGIVVGGMTNVLEQINSVKMRATEKKDYVKAMLNERGIPPALIARTKQYYNHYLLECADVATEQKILSELCPPLRTEVLLFLNARTVESIHFFHGQDSTFIVSVCKMLKPCFYAPHDWIFKEGELGLEMYFMQIGSVDVICYIDGEEIILDTLNSGDYLGEVAVMLDGVRREASARAVSFCSLFSFSKESLNHLLQMYPEVMHTMQEQMKARLRRWRLKRSINSVRSTNRLVKAFQITGNLQKDENQRTVPTCVRRGIRPEKAGGAEESGLADRGGGSPLRPPGAAGSSAAPSAAAPAEGTPPMRRPPKKSLLGGARRASVAPFGGGSPSSKAPPSGADDASEPRSPMLQPALNNTRSIEESLEKLTQDLRRASGGNVCAGSADGGGPTPYHLPSSAVDEAGGPVSDVPTDKTLLHGAPGAVEGIERSSATDRQSIISDVDEDPDVDGSLLMQRGSQLWAEDSDGTVTFQGGRRMSVEHTGQKLAIDTGPRRPNRDASS